MPLRSYSGFLTGDGITHLRLNVGWVEGLLSLHQRPGNNQHLESDLYQHLCANAFLPLATFQNLMVVSPEVTG